MHLGFVSRLRAGLLVGVCIFGLAFSGLSEEKTPDAPAKGETNENQQTLRSYLQLQEQLHDTLLTIERNRKETEAAARAGTEAISARLEAIERTMGAQESHQATLLQNSNRVTLIASSMFAVLGLLAMIFTATFLLRAMNRLGVTGPVMPPERTLSQGPGPLFPTDTNLMNMRPAEASGDRLLGVIERLEKRVGELEHTSHLSIPLEQTGPHNGSDHQAEQPKDPPSKAERVSMILGKGQSLLSMEKAEEAIACFDEAIALEPGNAEALVKKGTALEKLRRLDEAIQFYDRAITADRSMTLAYLYKGGVCNQLERFSEALACYEQALQSQQKQGA